MVVGRRDSDLNPAMPSSAHFPFSPLPPPVLCLFVVIGEGFPRGVCGVWNTSEPLSLLSALSTLHEILNKSHRKEKKREEKKREEKKRKEKKREKGCIGDGGRCWGNTHLGAQLLVHEQCQKECKSTIISGGMAARENRVDSM